MYDLNRFINAQKSDYNTALKEIKNGKKRSHWMWYIFPQLKGLGKSSTAEYYGIDGLKEAKEYYKNDYLRNNLLEITNELLKIDNNDIEYIMGYPDNLKLLSCMTLFSEVDKSNDLFNKVIDKYYDGKKDINTLNKL